MPPEAVAEIGLEEGSVPMEGEAMSFRMSIQKFDFQASKEEFEKQFLINALRAFRGKINQTALHANIPKKTLLRKLEKYGITAKDYN
jgi:DNA-binding NtrC family response regulator